ncbi:Nucleoside-diphosphate-sugar epimerase [Actinokineospora alba]|uniref:Nucleoside-diphosphate-sugar epimerase n=1 Tax=Actinokineospora alba TaxID=504798 RepID=A0A1H0HG59_9PSEU|nr:SDR family oxidoreductase [Actinokineospora alba]TDP64899.1 nucleoside-diphosphate-sugar epimerase [Actinokineospora alba]SDH48739.1 Nucleoside-diphosphate-sugar epimerase [Actinokineospora alba]SDO18107.1 Nucleoside-diphosphate-sugar epimerase [Actinokineospora alba]
MRVLVTGATGIVGTEVLRALRANGADVVGCSRSGSADGVLTWHLGVQPPPDELTDRPWDAIVHAAADIRWNLADEAALAANVDSARAVLPLIGAATNVVHVSTAFATGLRGDISSPDRDDYRNSYEWSKAAAEREIDAVCPNWTVRPPMIIGSREDGRIARFHGVYQVLEGYLWGSLPVMVANDRGPVELVAVDDVAAIVVDRVLAGRPDGKRSITPGAGADALAGKEVLDIVFDELNAWRRAHGVDPVDAPKVIEPRRWHRFFRPFAEQHLSRSQRAVLHAFDPYLPYWALDDHVHPDHLVTEVEATLRASIRYWADRHPRTASTTPRPWRAAT